MFVWRCRRTWRRAPPSLSAPLPHPNRLAPLPPLSSSSSSQLFSLVALPPPSLSAFLPPPPRLSAPLPPPRLLGWSLFLLSALPPFLLSAWPLFLLLFSQTHFLLPASLYLLCLSLPLMPLFLLTASQLGPSSSSSQPLSVAPHPPPPSLPAPLLPTCLSALHPPLSLVPLPPINRVPLPRPNLSAWPLFPSQPGPSSSSHPLRPSSSSQPLRPSTASQTLRPSSSSSQPLSLVPIYPL